MTLTDRQQAILDFITAQVARDGLPPTLAEIAREFGFLASRASDFHGPGESYTDLGRMTQLPPDLKPVWAEWH